MLTDAIVTATSQLMALIRIGSSMDNFADKGEEAVRLQPSAGTCQVAVVSQDIALDVCLPMRKTAIDYPILSIFEQYIYLTRNVKASVGVLTVKGGASARQTGESPA